MSLQEIVTALGALSSLALAAVALARAPRGRLQWSFGLGMVLFAAEALATFMLLTRTESPHDRLFWLTAIQAAGILQVAPWAFFVAGLASSRRGRMPLPLRLGVGVTTALALAGTAAALQFPLFELSDIAGPFYAARISWLGRLVVVAQLVGAVAVLAGLEAALRTSQREARWGIKFLVLGLGGIFLLRFYLLSQVLLFSVVMGVFLSTMATALFLGNLATAVSLRRDRLSVDLRVSRQVLLRSVVVGVLGLYLFALGVLGWVLNRLGIPEELLWASVVVFVSALALAAVLLSESLRWRIKRFVGLNLYRSKYDYREQWVQFTKRLGSLVTLEELAPQLVGAVVDAIGTARGILYLADQRDGRYHVAARVGVDHALPSLEADAPLVSRLAGDTAPLSLEAEASVLLDGAFHPYLVRSFSEGGVAVPLRWRGEVMGLLLIAPERTGLPYTTEDLEFLATVGEQAAGAIATARLSETLAQSREFEAFHRLTSFVIHDVKNSISALSMLSQNALEHFDDAEFQRDAIQTLSRTVERMKVLLARLSSPAEAAPLRFQPVDLAALALEATRPIAGGNGVSLVKDLAPVPPVPGDPEALLRVIQNLVTNAVEAVNGGGVVTVKTYQDHGWAVFSVTDTGCGMSEEFVRKSLFTPFRSTKKGGWGVGLYQAKGLVEGHGGTIEVQSKEGGGTTFRVRLPAERRASKGERS